MTARAETKRHQGATSRSRATCRRWSSGDDLRLRAALENLADNAVKFTEQGGSRLAVSAEPAARKRVRLIFTISDSGIGLSSAARSRGCSSRSRKRATDVARRFGGAGLGLVFVKRIAKAMGGDLRDQQAGPRLDLPVVACWSSAIAARRGAEAARSRAGARLTILCAEDNPYGRVVMNTILDRARPSRRFRRERRGGGGGGRARRLRRRADGRDAAAASMAWKRRAAFARCRARPRQMPVIGISGRSEAGDEAAARAAGMNFYFAKPVSPGKLAQVWLAITASR